MHISKLSGAFLLAIGASAAAPQTPSLSEWAIHQAPKNLARIDAFLAANSTFSEQQLAYVSSVQEAVRTMDPSTVAAIPKLEADCAALFDSEQCAALLSGQVVGEKQGGVKARITDCKCSTDSSYCKKNYYCSLYAGHCDWRWLACGTLLLYDCDGLCVVDT